MISVGMRWFLDRLPRKRQVSHLVGRPHANANQRTFPARRYGVQRTVV